MSLLGGGLLAAFVVGALIVLAVRAGLTLLKWGLIVLVVLLGIWLLLEIGSALGL